MSVDSYVMDIISNGTLYDLIGLTKIAPTPYNGGGNGNTTTNAPYKGNYIMKSIFKFIKFIPSCVCPDSADYPIYRACVEDGLQLVELIVNDEAIHFDTLEFLYPNEESKEINQSACLEHFNRSLVIFNSIFVDGLVVDDYREISPYDPQMIKYVEYYKPNLLKNSNSIQEVIKGGEKLRYYAYLWGRLRDNINCEQITINLVDFLL